MPKLKKTQIISLLPLRQQFYFYSPFSMKDLQRKLNKSANIMLHFYCNHSF